MSEEPFHLSTSESEYLLSHYQNQTVERLGYGTVAEYCECCDHIPFLPRIQGDLKDLQRPTALKMILGLCPPGSSLLEIGAGEPYVAQMLTEMGYKVTAVDPYDGSGRGPTEFDYYSRKYPDVCLVRDTFSDSILLSGVHAFDCIYSISVLEHVHQPFLRELFNGVKRFLQPGGYSLHLIDHVLAGEGADFHLLHLAEILSLQGNLDEHNVPELIVSFHSTLTKASADIETYFLSSEGHNLWRGQSDYRLFPFRKVISIHSCERRKPG